MKVSAKSDYPVRALLELAMADERPVKGERLAQAQEIPLKFLENILIDSATPGSCAPSGEPRAATGWLAHGTR